MSDNNELDRQKLLKMQYLILDLEDQNAKTKEYKDGQMVEKIKSIIIDSLRNTNF